MWGPWGKWAYLDLSKTPFLKVKAMKLKKAGPLCPESIIIDTQIPPALIEPQSGCGFTLQPKTKANDAAMDQEDVGSKGESGPGPSKKQKVTPHTCSDKSWAQATQVMERITRPCQIAAIGANSEVPLRHASTRWMHIVALPRNSHESNSDDMAQIEDLIWIERKRSVAQMGNHNPVRIGGPCQLEPAPRAISLVEYARSKAPPLALWVSGRP
jgi:hypothetical protein